jgi:hypothetical protein
MNGRDKQDQSDIFLEENLERLEKVRSSLWRQARSLTNHTPCFQILPALDMFLPSSNTKLNDPNMPNTRRSYTPVSHNRSQRFWQEEHQEHREHSRKYSKKPEDTSPSQTLS